MIQTPKQRRTAGSRFVVKLPDNFHTGIVEIDTEGGKEEREVNYFLGMPFSDRQLVGLFSYLKSQHRQDGNPISLDDLAKGGIPRGALEAFLSKLARFTVKGVMQPNDISQFLDLPREEISYILQCQVWFADTSFPSRYHAIQDFAKAAAAPNNHLAMEGDLIYFRKEINGRKFDIRIMQLGNYSESKR